MRVAVIGLGAMGRNHQRVLTELGHEVVTVDIGGHADYTEIVDADLIDANLDAACIAVPPADLPAVALDASKFTDRLLIEKPLARHPATAAFVAARLPWAWVGYVERFNPVLPVIDQHNQLGTVRRVEVVRRGLEARNDLGAWRDLATHDIDLLDALRISPEHATFDIGYGSEKLRTWKIEFEQGTMQVDWQHQSVQLYLDGEYHDPPVTHTEPLREQWIALLDGQRAPVDTRAAVQVLRSAVELEAAELHAAA